jgi:signal transduction histidine kinase
MLLALLLGLAISGVALTRMNALETQSLAAESELRRLSGQLRMAQEAERKHLSRELHDEVGQLLTGLRMELAGAGRLRDPSELTQRLESSKRTVEQLIVSIRNITLLLRPSMLDDLGLAAALGWLIKENSRTSGVDIRARLDSGADSLPEAHRTCLYRVVQEALTNVARHSGARKAEVVVQTEADWVFASISDDGRGFEPEPAKDRGLGVIGMEERVRELGGKIRVVSSPGRGARVEVHLPRTADAEVLSATSADRG